MPNNPMLNYKPGLTMDTPVSITMAAADWAVFMGWCARTNLDGISHIVCGLISPQVLEALYSQASIKGTEAHFNEQHAQNPFTRIVQTMQQTTFGAFPNPEDFGIADEGRQVWVIQCLECQSRDEYEPRYLGPLTCGHNGNRTLVQINVIPEGEG